MENKEPRVTKLALSELLNPEYQNLITEHNEIVDERNRLQRAINEYRIEKFQLWKISIALITPFNRDEKLKEFSIIGRKIVSLETKFLVWNEKAWNFCMKPHYSFDQDPDVDKQASVFHFTNFLHSLISTVGNHLVLLRSDYNLRCSEIENESNYGLLLLLGLLA